MAKKTEPADAPKWQISIIRRRGEYLGTIAGPTTEAGAIAKAIEFFKITEPERQRRLVARRVK